MKSRSAHISKRTLSTWALVIVPAVGWTQGTINLSTSAGEQTRFIVDGWTGQRLGGEAFWAQLYYANGSWAVESMLVAVDDPPVHPRSGAAAGVLASGTRLLNNINPRGGIATLQVRVWSAVLGATWEEAYWNWSSSTAAPGRCLGVSALFQIDTANPISFGLPPEVPSAIGASFPGVVVSSLSYPCIPEPATWAIGLCALLASIAGRKFRQGRLFETTRRALRRNAARGC